MNAIARNALDALVRSMEQVGESRGVYPETVVVNGQRENTKAQVLRSLLARYDRILRRWPSAFAD
jgi:hypothetical protein